MRYKILFLYFRLVTSVPYCCKTKEKNHTGLCVALFIYTFYLKRTKVLIIRYSFFYPAYVSMLLPMI